MIQLTQDELHAKYLHGAWFTWGGRAKSPVQGHIFVEVHRINPANHMPLEPSERGYAADFDWRDIIRYRIPTSKEESGK